MAANDIKSLQEVVLDVKESGGSGSSDSVKIVLDSAMTYLEALTALYDLIDFSKITHKSVLRRDRFYYHLSYKGTDAATFYRFENLTSDNGHGSGSVRVDKMYLNSNNGSKYEYFQVSGKQATPSEAGSTSVFYANYTSSNVAKGSEFELFY